MAAIAATGTLVASRGKTTACDVLMAMRKPPPRDRPGQAAGGAGTGTPCCRVYS